LRVAFIAPALRFLVQLIFFSIAINFLTFNSPNSNLILSRSKHNTACKTQNSGEVGKLQIGHGFDEKLGEVTKRLEEHIGPGKLG